MQFDREDLEWAAEQGILSKSQADQLWSALTERKQSTSDRPWYDPALMAYYAGAMVVIMAMGWFAVRAANLLGPPALMITSVVYGIVFAGTGWIFRYRRNLKTAGGLFFVISVTMAPVFIYSFERYTEIWQIVYKLSSGVGFSTDSATDGELLLEFATLLRESWIAEELTTIIIGGVALWYVRFPFMTAPIAFALWHMAAISMPPLIAGEAGQEAKLWTSVILGGGMMVGAFIVDRRTKADYAFWGYLICLLAYWGSLTLMENDTEVSYLLYFLINGFLVFLAAFLRRRAFLVFGSLGMFLYLVHLANKVFADSVLFPIALSALGGLIIYLGVKYQKHQRAVDEVLHSALPPFIRKYAPAERK